MCTVKLATIKNQRLINCMEKSNNFSTHKAKKQKQRKTRAAVSYDPYPISQDRIERAALLAAWVRGSRAAKGKIALQCRKEQLQPSTSFEVHFYAQLCNKNNNNSHILYALCAPLSLGACCTFSAVVVAQSLYHYDMANENAITTTNGK